ncbi:MAG TPA: ammonia-forming cytochrome c nitrite reductase subunit c552 [Anaeromyxobacter sp.]|nr:ammonia-forming cytochrome c nitrite reductase subunit c552 [Anaeromyxobacter sp.]
MTRIKLVVLAAAMAFAGGRAAAQTLDETCAGCHGEKATAKAGGLHAGVECATCHDGAATHAAAADPAAAPPRVHFDQEVCQTCHVDQYDTFEIVAGGKTFYGGSDPGSATHPAPKGWSKTADLPYWNVLIDGHPFVLETYEDRPMAVNQIEHQETIRPGSEACMECHGTRAAFMMGIEFVDKAGVTRSIPATKTQVTLPNGTVASIPAKVYEVRSLPNPPPPPDPVTGIVGHVIFDGTSHKDPVTGEWKEVVSRITIPVGTRVWTYTDGVGLSGGATPQPYEVRTVVTLPAPVTAPVLDPTGAQVGAVTFATIASFPEAGADVNGRTGFSPPAAADGNVANVARLWIYAALEALAFDGLDYHFDDPCHVDATGQQVCETHFTGGGANWPSIVSGELCNQCHDPHSGDLRIVKKSLIAAIGERGVNPYSPTGVNVLRFEQATRQDQIIAVCAQCHSEYVGGYSANTKLDQDYFPWAKPADLEALYGSLFGGLQDWTHGAPIAPWQSYEANARGFFPYGQRYVIGEPLVKVQHPEAETFMGSPMYNAGATCTDCHSTRVTRLDGTRYTSHWFTSTIKIMDGFVGTTETGVPIVAAPSNPCARCHVGDTIAQSKQRIRGVQDTFFFLQERTQVALVNGLRFIAEQKALGVDQSANVAAYQRAALRWEYYTQAENSMGFHNAPEATAEVSNARLWVDAFVPWPLTPVQARVTSVGSNSLTLTFYDQAPDEQGFAIERAPLLEGPYLEVARVPTPNGANLGDVSFTDTGLTPGATYFYRVAAYGAAGQSVPSIWAQGTTQAGPAVPAAPAGATATATGSSAIDVAWTDVATDETGYRVERAKDAGFTVEVATFELPANATALSDAGLAPSTTYFYRVFAFNANGLSGASNTASATTLAAPPAAPANLVVTAVGRNAITIAWSDRSADESGFSIERSTDGITFAAHASVGAGVTTFTDGGLPRRALFFYRVSAFSPAGSSAPSNVASARTR